MGDDAGTRRWMSYDVAAVPRAAAGTDPGATATDSAAALATALAVIEAAHAGEIERLTGIQGAEIARLTEALIHSERRVDLLCSATIKLEVRDNQSATAEALDLNEQLHRQSLSSSPQSAVNPGQLGHRLRRLTGLTADRAEEGMQPIGVSLIVAEARV
jgi:hypothetical protein